MRVVLVRNPRIVAVNDPREAIRGGRSIFRGLARPAVHSVVPHGPHLDRDCEPDDDARSADVMRDDRSDGERRESF
jgi:hypothetical protein